jgi:taurine dioxygenase
VDYRRIGVTKLTRHLGAEISGVELEKPLDTETFEEIQRALLENLVIFFRDQHLTHEQHKAFGARFGPLHIHPAAPGPEGHPEILIIHADERSRGVAGAGWHSDVSADAAPPMGSILYLEQVPEVGGDTLFASMYAAYDGLSDSLKQYLSGLTAIHESTQIYGRPERNARPTRAGETEFPQAEHPVIRTHPQTGRKAIFVNRAFTTRIKGLRRKESDAILGFLFEHCAAVEYQCRFRWRENSIAFWDNRCVQHYAVWDYYPAIRHGYRVTIRGDRPYYTA